jgi:hypothetical protein
MMSGAATTIAAPRNMNAASAETTLEVGRVALGY